MAHLRSQKELIHKRDWNCLIILDACRYDIFEKVYSEYLEGKLKKVKSAGVWTGEWLERTFNNEDNEDIVYVSDHPYINSKGREIVEGFDASKTFFRVIDVWNKHWSSDLGHVPPKQTSKETRLARAKFPRKKLISHFTHPHGPYLYLGGPLSERIESSMKQASGEESLTSKFRRKAGKIAKGILGYSKVLKIRKSIGLTNPGPAATVAQELGEDTLLKAYREDLKYVLSIVSKLSNRLPGKIVISTDHGECLGEGGRYGHGNFNPSLNNRILKTIPWLEVDGYA